NAFMALVLFILLLLSLALSPFWHSLAKRQESISYSLYSYDRQFTEGGNACFSLEIIASNVLGEKKENLLVSVAGKNVLAERIEISENSVKEHCFSTQNLGQKNLVEIFIGNERLFYSLEKTETRTTLIPVVSIEGVSILDGSKAELRFSAKNLPDWKAVPIEVFVNGQLDHRFFPEKGREAFSEKIFLGEGLNSIKVSVLGVSAETSVNHEKPFTLPFWAGIFLLCLVFFVLESFVFGKHGFIGGTALSLAGIVAIFIANAFLLNLFSAISSFSFTVLLLAETAIIVFCFKKNFSLKFFELKKDSVSLIEIILLLFFAFATLCLPLLMSSHQSPWSVYYERHANSVAEGFGIPLNDEFSYLGRPFSFVPGYFLFSGGIYWLTGALGIQLFAITIAFSNLLLLFSGLFFASRIGLKRNQAALFVLFLSMSTLVFTTITITPRHGIALSLLLVSLGLLFGKEKFWHSSVFLAAGLAVQMPLALFYPLTAFFAMPKPDFKKTIAALFCGIAFFLPFIFFMVSVSGMPSQAVPRLWGYLAPIPLHGLFQNPGLLFFFFCFFVLFEAFKHLFEKIEWDSLRKRLFLGVLFSCLLQVFVSSRADLSSAVLIACFLSCSMQKYEKELSNLAFFFFGLILLSGIAIAIILEPQFVFSQSQSDALKALRQNSSTESRVLCDPYYGHKIAFESQRATLADLMVEYADSEKLSDSYKFLDSGNKAILEKYGISLVFAENHAIYRHSFEIETFSEALEFREMDKVFTNNRFSIHRKR
ncbi:MAG: hypothetical protein QXK06_05620, partial [Candidatus Diapherotrites archaeon]